MSDVYSNWRSIDGIPVGWHPSQLERQEAGGYRVTNADGCLHWRNLWNGGGMQCTGKPEMLLIVGCVHEHVEWVRLCVEHAAFTVSGRSSCIMCHVGGEAGVPLRVMPMPILRIRREKEE